MERESNQMQTLCRSGCGFYGSPATDGLCSLCYKEALKKKQQLPTPPPASSSNHCGNAAALSMAAAAAATTTPITNHHTTLMTSSSTTDFDVTEPVEQGSVAVAGSTTTIAPSDLCAADISGSSPISSTGIVVSDLDTTGEDKDGDKYKKKKNRCAVCRKKVGLTGFQCRCGGLFCSVHRYTDEHECNFDYREMGAQEIRRNNPVVVGEKIQKI